MKAVFKNQGLRHYMSQLTAETLVGRMKGIPDFILGTIVEILESYDMEVMVAEGFIFERCPVCPACHRQSSTKFHFALRE